VGREREAHHSLLAHRLRFFLKPKRAQSAMIGFKALGMCSRSRKRWSVPLTAYHSKLRAQQMQTQALVICGHAFRHVGVEAAAAAKLIGDLVEDVMFNAQQADAQQRSAAEAEK
jgi:hypothetical protein